MKKEPLSLILLGDPGAGKATQGKRLVRKYPFREFDFGEWLRSLKSPAARRKYHVEEILRGILAPTHLAKIKFREVILKTPKSKGIFFNGNPKMEGEAKAVVSAFRKARRPDPLVIYLKIPKGEMLKRLEIRARKDDTREYLENRMRYYKEHLRPMVAYFKTRYNVVTISGAGTEETVFKRIVTAIEKSYGTH
jgi:adenylate kinase